MPKTIRKTLDKDLWKQELIAAVVGTLAVKPSLRAKFAKNPTDYLKNNGINPNSVDIEILSRAVFDLERRLSRTMITRIEKAFPRFPTAFVKFIIIPKIRPIVPSLKPMVLRVQPQIKPILPEVKPILPKIKPYMPCLDVKIDIERIKVLEDLKPLITKSVLNRILKIK